MRGWPWWKRWGLAGRPVLSFTSHARRRMEERRISPQVAEVALVLGKKLPGGEHAARYRWGGFEFVVDVRDLIVITAYDLREAEG